MRIGLITIYHVPNYGSVLQAFATQKLLEKLGHECQIIKYKYPNKWHYKHGFIKPNIIKVLIHNLCLKACYRGAKQIEKFRKKNLKYTKEFKSLKELGLFKWEDFDILVSGSDQLWNAKYVKGDSVFMLSFAPINMPRISIASSFALKEIPFLYIEKYKKELVKFNYLSVREKKGVEIINSQLGIKKDIFVCLDPTLLINKKEWLELLPRSNFRKKRSYILLYLLSYAFDPRPYIYDVLKFFQEKLECDIYAIAGYSSEYLDKGLKMYDVSDSSVSKFIDLFANADLVVTSSFHGSAFAINFGRQLISIVPDNDNDDRQASFLESVGASSSIVTIGSEIEKINPNYDFNSVEKKLIKMREECISWLNNSINSCL